MRAVIWVFLMVVLGIGSAAARREPHPVLDLWSREELVELGGGYGEEKLSTVLITGSVHCPDHDGSNQPEPVSGARVVVTCSSGGDKGRKSFREETVTDEFGDFVIDLPSRYHGTRNLDRACRVKADRVPAGWTCNRSFARMVHKGIELSSAHNGVRTYTTGKIILHGRKPDAGQGG